jgi:hypothetical protein
MKCSRIVHAYSLRIDLRAARVRPVGAVNPLSNDRFMLKSWATILVAKSGQKGIGPQPSSYCTQCSRIPAPQEAEKRD